MNYRQSAILPTEFRLATACCRWAFAGGSAETILDRSREVDWQRFVAVVGRHRVEGLVWHSLDSLSVPLPAEVDESLSASARSIADHGLRAAAESARLLKAFEQAGVPLLFIKGLTLGKLAYSNPFLKMSWDIDVLIPLAQVAEAAVLLEEMGYRRVLPAGAVDRRELEAWHRRRKESVWVHAGKQLHLELHGRLPDSPWLIKEVGIDSLRQLVEVAPGIVLPTLARDELFAYLCVHGALSAWHRLKWLADCAALLDGIGEDEIGRLYAASQALGAGRATGLALLLTHMLFEVDIGDNLARRLAADRTTRWLVRIALNQLAGREDLKEPTERTFGTVMIHFSHLLLAPRWSLKWRELRRKAGEAIRNRRIAPKPEKRGDGVV